MIALLVTTVALLAESPSVAAASPSLVSSARRVSRIARRGARLAICVREAVLAQRAEPDQALDVERQARVEAAQAPLGAELEERVRLQPRLLGLAVLAGADGGLHAVERERDQVVVGLVGLLRPRLRHRGACSAFSAARLDLLDLLVGGDAFLVLLREVDERAELGDGVGGDLRAARVALGELVAQVRERADGAGAEGDGLLDLEVARDVRVLHAAAVLDRDELEELQQLLGAAGGLLRRERGGGEAGERLVGAVQRGGQVRGRGQRVERGAAPAARPRRRGPRA